ncbi:unnamed protein product [Cylicocyclus nassatus]|uniref:Uncharacterized protein n=1 Tax=Cylicocyclus nassatus TaxID=53992 RepID=A0AA36DRG4_CYLNA|nr:unnamed protein product [Cylicocyclus nassatus]
MEVSSPRSFNCDPIPSQRSRRRRGHSGAPTPKREAKLPGSTITTSKNLLNVTAVTTSDAFVTSGKGSKGTARKTQGTTNRPMMALPTDFIIAVIVTIVVLGLLFWVLVLMWERRRRTQKWEDYKKYEQERREYKRQMKLRRKKSKKFKKKGEFARKEGRLHMPTELQRKNRFDKYARIYAREKDKVNGASQEKDKADKPFKKAKTPEKKGSRDEDRLQKGSRSKEGGSRHSKENESKQPLEKREESAEPADVKEIERAIKGGKMSLASFEKDMPEKMKGEIASMTANEEEAPGKREETPEKKPGDPQDKWLHEDYLF